MFSSMLAKQTRIVLAVVLLAGFVLITLPAPPTLAAPIAYSVRSDVNDQLYQIDLATGVATAIGPVGFADVEGLAFDCAGNLFGVDDVTDQLITINLATGAGTVVGSLGIGGVGAENDFGLAFDSAGNAWLSTDAFSVVPVFVPGNFYSVNPTTGAATLVGPQGRAVTGLAVSAGGVIYGLGGDGTLTQPNTLVTINSATGAATVVGPLGGAVSPLPDGGIDFDAGGTLWGLGDPGLGTIGEIFTINPATGTATAVATITIGGVPDGGFEGLAVSSPCAPTPTPTPTNTSTPTFTPTPSSTPPSVTPPPPPVCDLSFVGSGVTSANGDFYLGCFNGIVFEDNDRNGIFDVDHRIEGVTVTVNGTAVCVTVPPGYFNTTPTCVTQPGGGRVDFGLAKIESPPPPVQIAGGAGCGEMRVIAPSGALPEGTTLILTPNTALSGNSVPGFRAIRAICDITTNNGVKTFSLPITVCARHNESDLAAAGREAANLRVDYFDGALWHPLLPASGGESNETCGATDHLTQFGLGTLVPDVIPTTGIGYSTWRLGLAGLAFVAGAGAGWWLRKRRK